MFQLTQTELHTYIATHKKIDWFSFICFLFNFSFCCFMCVFFYIFARKKIWNKMNWVGNLITYVVVFINLHLIHCVSMVLHRYFFKNRFFCFVFKFCCTSSVEFIVDLMAVSYHHHYHLSLVHPLFCSPFSISYVDSGTRFLFAVRLGTVRERFRYVVFGSGND